MSLTNLRTYPFFILLSLFLFSCGNTSTESAPDTKPDLVKNNKELTKPDIQTIEFYSGSNQESMEEILTKTVAAKKIPIFFFTADWCKPCKEFKAAMKYELVASSLKDATLIVINVDKDKKKEGYASDYGVRAIPTFIIVDQQGNAINTITGAAWAENTAESVSKAMAEFLRG